MTVKGHHDMNNSALLRLTDVHKTYRTGEMEVPAVRGVSLEIKRGEFVALMGASGSGKSTLMNILGCLDRPTSGHYVLDGADVSGLDRDRLADIRNRKIGFVFQNFNPSQLSGGQQQRVAIGRALINDPEVVLADEPTGNLDSRTSVEIMGIFQQLNERGITIIMVTHEQDIAAYARRNVVMRDGILLSDKVVTQRATAEAELDKLARSRSNREE